jgi:ATP-dependent helicase/nuclease subunit A
MARIGRSAAAERLLEILRHEMPGHPVMRQRCQLLMERLPRLAENRDPAAALGEVREAAKVQGGGGKGAWSSEEVYAAFRDAASSLRDEIEKVRPEAAFDVATALPAAETALRLFGLADAVAGRYQDQKRELAALDFADLVISARDLLVGPHRAALRKHLAAQTRLLLVDEFQDTDPVQVELVRALCDGEVANGKLFFVGDYKQSIYRFRGADPHVFRRLRDEIPAAGRLPLSLNFRSQPAVLAVVNALFAEELGPDYEPLRANRPQVGPVPAVEFLWAVEPPAASQESPPMAASQEQLRRREADWIARRIRQMLDGGERLVWDNEAAKAGGPAVRAVRPGDVALLFRALSNVEYYEDALRRYGIPDYLVGGHAFYAQQEIFDLVNLLRVLADPRDKVSLAGVLRSPMFGLLDETLYALAQHSDGLAAGLAACGKAEKGDRSDLPRSGPPGAWHKLDLSPFSGEVQRQRAQRAATILAELRAVKDRLPIAALMHEALARTGYDAVLLAEFLGPRKLANLHKLIDDARGFDASGLFTLGDFITQLSEFVARQPDEPLAATQPASIDAVRLMTIHQAKGLEFPVVVVPDLDRQRLAFGSGVAFTPRLGPMVRIRGSDATSGYDLFRRAESEEGLAELVRLFYVATTRAADYLILSAGLPEVGASRGPWTELVYRRFDPATGAARAADAKPQAAVRVIASQPPVGATPAGTTPWRDLEEVVYKARQMAARGEGRVPAHLAAVPPDPAARREFSFSRLSGAMHAREAQQPVDDDGPPPSTIDPLGLGTLVHAVLAELASAARAERITPPELAAIVRRHAYRHLPDVQDALDEPIDMLGRFLASPRWADVAAAAEVHAELEFLLAWPPSAANGEAASGESAVLRGFIDCLYCDAAGGWHLLDYKTNRVTPDGVARVAAEYEMQMLVYALAVEKILGAGPAEVVLHFLRIGREHTFRWDEAARRRAVALVEQAITATV